MTAESPKTLMRINSDQEESLHIREQSTESDQVS